MGDKDNKLDELPAERTGEPEACRAPRQEVGRQEVLLSMRSDAILQAFFRAFPDLYFLMDAEGTILDYHAGDPSDLYAPPESFLGRGIRDVLPPAAGEGILRAVTQVLMTGEMVSLEYSLPLEAGEQFFEARFLPILDRQVIAMVRNISRYRLNEARLEALARLNEMADASLREITDFALEEAVRLTRSRIGFLAFLDEDESHLIMHAWSKGVMEECGIAHESRVYPVATSGLLGEAVRRRRPVIINDYSASPGKKGCPDGHVRLVRLMSTPIFEGERIVIVAGVGNKDEGYDETDVRQLTLLMQGMWRLIQRRRADEELRKWRDAFHHTKMGVVIGIPENTTLEFMNPAYAEMHGYTVDELTGKSAFDLYPPDLHGELREHIRLAHEKGHHVFETKHLRKGGTVFPVMVNITSMKDGKGEPLYSIVNVQEITERKRMEEALRESEERFSKAFRATPTILVIATFERGRYIEVNETFERMVGYRRDEAIGRSSVELNIWGNPGDRARVVRMIKEKGEVRDLEVKFRSREGKIFDCLYSAEPITVQGELCLLSMVTDITARKRAEEALRKSERRLRRAITDAPFPVMIHAEDGEILQMSRVWTELTGYRRRDIRTASEWIERAFGDRKEQVTAEIAKLFTLKERRRGGEYAINTANGGQLVWDFSSTPLGRLPDRRRLVLTMAVDMTARKRMQEEIEILNTDLASKAMELETANRDLEAFNYSVSHDLRTPLTGINGYCQIIMDLYGDRLDEKCLGYLREINGSGEQMDELITALLDFSRLSRKEMVRETVDLSATARMAAGRLRMNEPHRRVEFAIAEGVTAEGDPKLLRVVVENLLGNAWKYTGRREEARIEFGTVVIEGSSACFVRDNGIGFDMAQAGRLFDTFRRLPGSEGFEGHGIGLATVHRIIQRHGGRIWAEGEPGNGATFYFTLG